MILNSSQIRSYKKNGFVVVDDFFSENELKRFADTLKKVILINLRKAQKKYSELDQDFLGKEYDELIIKLEELDHQYIADIYDSIYSTHAFLSLVSKKEISESINKILGRESEEPIYLDQARCRIDTPYDPSVKKCGWHQEVFYYVPKSQFIQIWAPLINDAKKENGAIEVCLGSHKKIAKQTNKRPEGEKYPFIVDDAEIKKYKIKTMELNLGQLLVFDSRLIHRSGENISKEVRYSLVGINHNLDNEFFVPPKFEEIGRKEKFEEYYNSLN